MESSKINNSSTKNFLISAQKRIKNYIKNTPLISSNEINQEFAAQIFFKMENQQETGSFKARGAFNAILAYYERYKKFPQKIVAQSSGNHAQAVAFAAKQFGIPTLIYMAKITSPFKVQATRNLGAEVVLCEKRSEANKMAEEKQAEGYFFIHPSDNDDVILGQATCALEAFQEVGNFEAIFAACGGGGLLSGSFLTAQEFSQNNEVTKVFGCEPLNANDAALSVRNKKIFSFEDSPNTIADGARTLKVSQRCFDYLQKLNDILEIGEEEIIFWQKELTEKLKQKIEPTAALAMAGCAQFLQKDKSKNLTDFSTAKNSQRKFLVIISGGNLE